MLFGFVRKYESMYACNLKYALAIDNLLGLDNTETLA